MLWFYNASVRGVFHTKKYICDYHTWNTLPTPIEIRGWAPHVWSGWSAAESQKNSPQKIIFAAEARLKRGWSAAEARFAHKIKHVIFEKRAVHIGWSREAPNTYQLETRFPRRSRILVEAGCSPSVKWSQKWVKVVCLVTVTVTLVALDPHRDLLLNRHNYLL